MECQKQHFSIAPSNIKHILECSFYDKYRNTNSNDEYTNTNCRNSKNNR